VGILYEGEIEEAGKPPKMSESTQVRLKVLQESKNHNHGDFNYLFWPDLAHGRMNENVYFVDETTNPPNVPQVDQLRTYGVFWHRKFMREGGRPQGSRS
jgi:hypothetical protein